MSEEAPAMLVSPRSPSTAPTHLGWHTGGAACSAARSRCISKAMPTRTPRRAGARFPAGAEPKTGKNRLHLDVRSGDFATAGRAGPRTRRHPSNDIYAGGVLAVLRDPEGNEFCILRPRA